MIKRLLLLRDEFYLLNVDSRRYQQNGRLGEEIAKCWLFRRRQTGGFPVGLLWACLSRITRISVFFFASAQCDSSLVNKGEA
jgi:hypothetical protein